MFNIFYPKKLVTCECLLNLSVSFSPDLIIDRSEGFLQFIEFHRNVVSVINFLNNIFVIGLNWSILISNKCGKFLKNNIRIALAARN